MVPGERETEIQTTTTEYYYYYEVDEYSKHEVVPVSHEINSLDDEAKVKMVYTTEKHAVENNMSEAKKPSPNRTDSIISKIEDSEESASKPIECANDPEDKHFDPKNAVVTRAHFRPVKTAS